MGGINYTSDWYQHYYKCRLCKKRKKTDCFIDLKEERNSISFDVCKSCLKDLNNMLARVNNSLEG
jgi:transcription elongation factor Elf1